MSTLITNLPSYEVWVRKEYLTDHKSGHGEFVKESGFLQKVYLVVPFILKLICLSTLRSSINCRYPLFSRLLRPQILI